MARASEFEDRQASSASNASQAASMPPGVLAGDLAMETLLHFEALLGRFRRVPVLALATALAILGAAIFATTWQVRARIREQITGRDGEVLQAVALMEYANDVEQGLPGPITDPASQLGIALKISRLKGVLGVRLFDPEGRAMETFPPDVRDAPLRARDLPALAGLRPVCHFHPRARLSQVFLQQRSSNAPPEAPVPLLEVNVPLHAPAGSQLAGVAQFLIEGQSIAAEYARLDRHLALQALGAFAAGGGLLAAALAWAFRRLRRAHELLAERTANLLKANQELALAAKTSALGAVTAHLLHGLRNPVAGLQSFIALHGAEQDRGEDTDWQQAVAATRRMHNMINQVVSVLREEETGVRYEVTLGELGQMVQGRVQSMARERGVAFETELKTAATLPNRVASLTALILANLAQNALEATPPGRAVRLLMARGTDHFHFDVCDEGSGFPAPQTPFTPCRSAKAGGSGIGLALSKQLALHLGAALTLHQNTPGGCIFRLALPATFALESADSAPVAAPQ